MVQKLITEERIQFGDDVNCRFSYGTAGFRGRAENLNRVVFRIGVLSALRSKVVGGK